MNAEKDQDKWLTQVVYPKIGATPRAAQKLSTSYETECDEVKAMLTWRTADRFIDEVAEGNVEQLFKYVGNPADFIERRKTTSVVVADATALWLKLRGEEKVLTSTREQNTAARRKVLARKFRGAVTEEEKAKYAEEAQAFMDETRGPSAQVKAMYSTSGDKYRVTLLNISGVEDWFDPEKAPRSTKRRSILIVPCAKHCRVSDMDLETKTWRRDVQYRKSDGSEEHFKQGDPVGQMLRGWTSALDQMTPDERSMVLGELDIWGQPRAWTDELVATWMFEFIANEYGQALAFGDCLGSQWTEAACLRAWLSQVVLAPYAPDVTSFLP